MSKPASPSPSKGVVPSAPPTPPKSAPLAEGKKVKAPSKNMYVGE